MVHMNSESCIHEGNPSWLRENLVERFDAEKAQALEMFSQEMQERGL